MNADVNGGTVGLLALNSLDVKGELSSIALNDLAGLLAFVVATDNLLKSFIISTTTSFN